MKAALTILVENNHLKLNDIRDLYFQNSTINLSNLGKREVPNQIYKFFEIDEVECLEI